MIFPQAQITLKRVRGGEVKLWLHVMVTEGNVQIQR